MNAPALYTPATLARIRAGATAASLGWDQQRFERVCRHHAIPLGGAIIAAAPDVTEALPAPDEPAPERASIPSNGMPRWDEKTSRFISDGAAIEICGRNGSETQRYVISAFVKAFQVDQLGIVQASGLAVGINVTREAVRGAISKINGKILPLGWCITGLRGSGYRLERIDLREEGPK